MSKKKGQNLTNGQRVRKRTMLKIANGECVESCTQRSRQARKKAKTSPMANMLGKRPC